MKPTLTEAAATLLRATLTDRHPKAAEAAARALEAIPTEHPLRQDDDIILERARAVRKGFATPEHLAAWAAELET